MHSGGATGNSKKNRNDLWSYTDHGDSKFQIFGIQACCPEPDPGPCYHTESGPSDPSAFTIQEPTIETVGTDTITVATPQNCQAKCQAESGCAMFLHLHIPASSSNPEIYICGLLSESAWSVPQAEWTPPEDGASVTVGPKNGCRRPDWAK